MQPVKKKKGLASVLYWAYPVAKYAAVLFVSLNLHRLPRQVELLQGITGPRWLLMLWSALLMLLGVLADRRAVVNRRKDETLEGQPNSGMNLLSFLALAVPCLLLLDAVAITHMYFCWFQGGAMDIQPLQTSVMAIGCVLWIYGRALPSVPFGSIWGIRIEKTMRSPETWHEAHLFFSKVFCFLSGLFLIAGSFM